MIKKIYSKKWWPKIVARIRMVWSSIPEQLAKENKKFLYGLIREEARAREYEVAITWVAPEEDVISAEKL